MTWTTLFAIPKVVCDMCTAGNLKHPESQQWLRKRTQIWTTSQILWRMLQQFQCVGNHSHDQIAGSCNIPGWGRASVTKYTELYTALFGKLFCRATLCSCQVHERVFGINQALTVTTSLAREDPEPKRRREVSSGTFVYRPSRLIRRKHSPESAPCSHEHIRQVRHVVSSPGSPPHGRNMCTPRRQSCLWQTPF